MRHTFDIALHRFEWLAKAVADYRRTIGSLRDHLAFVWALAFRGTPSLLPHLHGAVAQGAMGSILPTHVEERRIDGITNSCGKEFLLISMMRQSFFRSDEPCAKPGGRCAEREDRCDAAPIGNASCRRDRNWPNRIDHGGHQRKRADRATNMASSLPALSNNHIRTGRGSFLCLRDAAD